MSFSINATEAYKLFLNLCIHANNTSYCNFSLECSTPTKKWPQTTNSSEQRQAARRLYIECLYKTYTKTIRHVGGRHSSEVAFVVLTQQPRVRFSAFPRIFSDKLYLKKFILDVAKINRRHFLDCGQLEYVDQTI